jgi:DNA-binding PadR family transcriptional regulator
MFDAGALRYVVLQLIAERPRHGYDIIKEIEQHVGGGYAPSPGAIYPLLALLEDLGHVVVTPDGNKKLHKITPEGRAFLKENRAFVDAIFARMAGGSEERGRYNLRRAMHDIKAALMERADEWALSDEQVQKIQTILERAASEIRKLA